MDKLPLARNAIKVLALVVGGLGTVLCTMAVVGLVTDNGWARVAVAVVFAIALPALLADRLAPEDPEQAAGATSDVFAFTWMAITVGVALGAGAVTRPVLAAEGDRLARADMGILASALYALAGVTPTPAGAAPEPPSKTSATSSVGIAPAHPPTGSEIPFSGPPSSAAGEDAAPAESAGASSPPPPERAESSEREDEMDEEPEPPPRRRDDEVFALALPSLATIATDGPRGLRGGSGVFVSADVVATCRHFFDEATSVSLTFPSSRDPVEAVSVVAEEPNDDLVLVRVARPDATRPAPFPIATAEPIAVERAVLVGDPLGLGPTLLAAPVSRHEPPAAPRLSVDLSAPTLGSPIYDDRAQLVGIVAGPDEPRVITAERIAALLARPLSTLRAIGSEPTAP